MWNRLFNTFTLTPTLSHSPTLSLWERARVRGKWMRLNDKGFSLIASVLAMTGLAVMGMVFAGAVVRHQFSVVNEHRASQALYIAERTKSKT